MTVRSNDPLGEGTLRCPSCKKGNVMGHVENDRIAWWSCESCDYQWRRGQWAPPSDESGTAENSTSWPEGSVPPA